MINESLKTQFIDALNRFQLALRNHDHPNLSLQNHMHPEYALTTDVTNLVNSIIFEKDVIINLNSVGGILTIDLSLSNYYVVALTEDITEVILTNPPGGALGISKKIFFNHDATPRTIVWPSIFRKEGGGITDALSTTPNVVDVLTITNVNAGASYITTLSKGYD